MKISGFSYVRNGLNYNYPFIQAIKSILPVCDEFVIAVGDSTDGTREAIEAIGDNKIRIIDTIWDENNRKSGKIFGQQANIALRETTGDWAFHIQADECIHENDLNKIYDFIKRADKDERVEGLLFDFLNFYGSYKYLNASRYQHTREVRVIRNHRNIYSYKDSQGFRRYPSFDAYLQEHKGYKLKVLDTNLPVFHYNYVRRPDNMSKKAEFFEKFWHNDQYLEKKYNEVKTFDYYNSIDRVKLFNSTHPALMQSELDAEDWEFDPKKITKLIPLKDKIIYSIEDFLQYRFGDYKNYVKVR
jgi:hypothetical protein